MNLLQDFRFALRSLHSRPGTAVFAVLTLATGMAAAIAISCVIEAVLLRALPYPRASDLVQISEVATDGHVMALAQPNYDDLVARSTRSRRARSIILIRAPSAAATRTIARLDTTVGGDFFGTLGVAPSSAARSIRTSATTSP